MTKEHSDNIENPVHDGKLGRGLTNGNGFTNGFAAANAPRERSRFQGEPPAAGDIQTYQNGFTNGNGFTMGNGMTNGNGVNGKLNRIPLVRSKRLRSRVLGFAVAVIMVLAPLSLYLIDLDNGADGIVIDGDFRDWKGAYRHTDSGSDLTSHPNVNIIETSIVSDDDRTSFLLVVDGWIFKGGSSGGADSVHIMIDSDTDETTGYQYKGIGADYMVYAYGRNGRIQSGTIFIFDENYKSSVPRAANDWNAWNPFSSRMASSGNKLEVGLEAYWTTMSADGNMHAIFETRDYAGFCDSTETVSSHPGYVVVDQEPAAQELTIESGPAQSALRLVATAHESDVIISGMDLDTNNQFQYTTEPALPVTLMEGESREFTVFLDTGSAEIGDVASVKLSGVDAFTSGVDNAPVSVPVSVSGQGHTTYVDAVPNHIVIDGAFGDWAGIIGHADDINEALVKGNGNIDIREHRTANEEDTYSFYLRVDGTIMAGAQLIAAPIKDLERVPKPVQVKGVEEEFKDPLYGYDYAYIMLDVDGRKITGYNQDDVLGADFMLRMFGQNGKVLESQLFRYNIYSLNEDGPWELVGDVPAANSGKELETQVLLDMLNIDNFNSLDYYIMMTDWSRGLDTAADPYMGGGQPGSIQVIKMDDSTEHQEPKLSNSRNPYTTRSSSRATYSGGDWAGGDLDLVTFDTLNPGKYYNIDRFSVPSGALIFTGGPGVIMIKAAHIWINGTIDASGMGVTGGNGGAVNGGNGQPGGNNYADGNGSGGTGVANSGGGGGGGGGYGGFGGTGGAGGGDTGVGTGGAGGLRGTTIGHRTAMNITWGRGGGGGGGGGGANGAVGATGGTGGGSIWLQATTNFGIAGVITVNGTAGSNGQMPPAAGGGDKSGSGGGGGGSGGGILIKLDSTTNPLTISGGLYAVGGNGGLGGNGKGNNDDGGGGGGAGGGGRIKIFINGSFSNSSIMSVAKGTNGTAGTSPGGTGFDGADATGGTAGTIYVVPEFSVIAIPVTFTIIVFFTLNARRRKRVTRGNKASGKEVIL